MLIIKNTLCFTNYTEPIVFTSCGECSACTTYYAKKYDQLFLEDHVTHFSVEQRPTPFGVNASLSINGRWRLRMWFNWYVCKSSKIYFKSWNGIVFWHPVIDTRIVKQMPGIQCVFKKVGGGQQGNKIYHPAIRLWNHTFFTFPFGSMEIHRKSFIHIGFYCKKEAQTRLHDCNEILGAWNSRMRFSRYYLLVYYGIIYIKLTLSWHSSKLKG